MIPAILGILSILTVIIIEVIKKNKKRLSYEILSNVSLLSLQDEGITKLKVTFENQEVSNVRIFELAIFNNGNIPIEPADFETDIEIKIQDSSVLEVHNLSNVPDNLQVFYQITAAGVKISKLLINKGDRMNFKFILADAAKPSYSISARIKGVQEIKRAKRSGFIFHPLEVVTVLVVAFVIILGFVAMLQFEIVFFSNHHFPIYLSVSFIVFSFLSTGILLLLLGKRYNILS